MTKKLVERILTAAGIRAGRIDENKDETHAWVSGSTLGAAQLQFLCSRGGFTELRVDDGDIVLVFVGGTDN